MFISVHLCEVLYRARLQTIVCYCVVRGLMQRVMGMESNNGLDNRENIKYVVRFLIDSGVVARRSGSSNFTIIENLLSLPV